MSSKVRYVFDTNVIVSALLFESSNPSKVFRYALKNGEVLLSRLFATGVERGTWA